MFAMSSLLWTEPNLIYNHSENSVTVTGEQYHAVINRFLWPELKDLNPEHLCFQQHSTRYQIANETMAVLNEKFKITFSLETAKSIRHPDCWT